MLIPSREELALQCHLKIERKQIKHYYILIFFELLL